MGWAPVGFFPVGHENGREHADAGSNGLRTGKMNEIMGV